jgi:hypothetical protein
VGYPVSLYGSVYARDALDRKRVYLFRRDQDNAQLVKSPVMSGEINLHIMFRYNLLLGQSKAFMLFHLQFITCIVHMHSHLKS